MIDRLKAAWAAFRYSVRDPAYAVIYDSYEGLDRDAEGPVETYYEAFGSPEQAYEMFNTAFPFNVRAQGETAPGSERLVMILGPIDRYSKEPS